MSYAAEKQLVDRVEAANNNAPDYAGHSAAQFTEGQWPDGICSGKIRYGRAGNYDGFYLADASHGIPTIGSVADGQPPTIRGQHVRVFNYPSQTEAIAAQLVTRWNSHPELLAALREVVHEGLVYWEPVTSRGVVQKADMMARMVTLLEQHGVRA